MGRSVTVEVAIIGSGFSGIAAARELAQLGVHDVLLLEAADSVGGTWRDNTYPGCACDVPSHLYSLSWAPNPDWSHVYARQAEIRAYIERVVDDAGLRDRIRLGARVAEAQWNSGSWTLTLADGAVVYARFLVLGIGALRDPVIPDLPGISAFSGSAMHTARWDDAVDLTGKRVVLVGTGASAIQVLPAIAPHAEHVTVVQRTPPWVTPRRDRTYTAAERAMYRLPGTLAASRLATYLRQEALYFGVFGRSRPLNRVVRRWLTRNARRLSGRTDLAPSYDVGCKRVLISDDWYPALARDNVDLVTRPVARVVPSGVVLDDDTQVLADVLVWCTGFAVDAALGDLEVIGQSGGRLSERWKTRPSAYLGITVPDLPNAYTMLGPNTALGHSSVVVMIEAQARYLAQAIAYSRQRGVDLVVRQDALDAFVDQMDTLHQRLVWQSGGCRSWYQSDDGVNFTIWPGSSTSYLWATRRFDPAPYDVLSRVSA